MQTFARTRHTAYSASLKRKGLPMKHNLHFTLPVLTGAVVLSLSTAPLLPVIAAPTDSQAAVSGTTGSASSTASASQITDYSAVFDADYYYQTYPDLQASVGNDPAALLSHFIKTGMKEGRNGNAQFNLKAYMYQNPDLMAIYGTDLPSYYRHYITNGKAENRKAVFDVGKGLAEGVLGSYTTTFDTTEDRATNVTLSASRINGLVIPAGGRFSYSTSVGTRTTANGYVEAPSYASGRVVTSVGGGICQVSSTLYAAMVVADIPATSHYLHSLPVDYVPRGLDAAIVEGYKDLTFVNPFSYPIMLQTSTNNGVLTVSIVKAG